jgi:hypothetical protein
VLAVNDSIFLSDGEHEGVADNGRIAIQLQARFPQVIAEIVARSGPGMVNHEEVEGQAVLAVGGDKPFVEGELFGRCRFIRFFVFGEDAFKMAVDGIPDFLFCGGIHMVYSFKNSNEFHE